MVNGRKWYLQGGIFLEATGCSLDRLQLVFCQFFIFQNEKATGPKSGCNRWLVRSSCGLFCGFELDLESLIANQE